MGRVLACATLARVVLPCAWDITASDLDLFVANKAGVGPRRATVLLIEGLLHQELIVRLNTLIAELIGRVLGQQLR